MSFKVPEEFRIRGLGLGMLESDVNNGAFQFRSKKGDWMFAVASDGGGWEHVSVSMRDWRDWNRTPTWEEMCEVKDLFWGPEDCVVQFHPPKSQYVNNHNFCLHLWRKIGSEFETPPSIMVGLK